MNIKKVGVLGAGIMGTGVALDLACYDFQVFLKDKTAPPLEKAKENIKKDFRMIKMMKKKCQNVTIDHVLDKITFTTDYESFSSIDLIVENVTEDWGCKEKVYGELKEVCPRDTYYAVNTSCISITKIASLLPTPKRVIGMHFMNPVPLKPMVETICGYHTSSETVQNMTEFLKSLDKTPVVVNDYPGFVANRLSHLFINEAAYVLQDQVATPEQVDQIFKQGYGHKMGPLETADLIGLDTVVNSLKILYESYQDSKFRCCPLMQKMVDAGLLGRKSGKGFFTYDN